MALSTYFGYLQNLFATYYDLDSGFDLPTPVPPDLLMPFGEFVTKYLLGDAVSTIFLFGQGLGDLLSIPTVHVLKNFSLQVLSSFFSGGFLACPTGISTIYETATTFLGDRAMLNSSVRWIHRGNRGVKVWVDTPGGI